MPRARWPKRGGWPHRPVTCNGCGRLRLAADLRLTERLGMRARLAGRYGTDQNGMSLYLKGHTRSASGLSLGQATVDELHLTYRPTDRWTVRLGRMQTRAERMGLEAIIALEGEKALDRKIAFATRLGIPPLVEVNAPLPAEAKRYRST
jgi:hypothetical protein